MKLNAPGKTKFGKADFLAVGKACKAIPNYSRQKSLKERSFGSSKVSIERNLSFCHGTPLQGCNTGSRNNERETTNLWTFLGGGGGRGEGA